MKSDPTYHRTDPRPLFNQRPVLVQGYDTLKLLLGAEGVYQWARALPLAVKMDTARYEAAISNEIDRLTEPECNCQPLGDACPRCVAVAALRALDTEELEFVR
jgi:hypothetical protein